jgi:DNA mismatch repair protein PMS2
MDEENDNDGGGAKRMDSAVPAMHDNGGDDNDDTSLSTATNTKMVSRSTWRSIDENVSVDFQLSHLGRKAPKRPCQQDATMATLESSLKNASIGTDDNELAAVALNRVISKEDFSRFQVIGQFNLGFIIGLLDGYDLFIIDQHAADEKYNFETLQATTRLDGQKLIR